MASSSAFLAVLISIPAVAVAQSHPVRIASGLVSGVSVSGGMEVYKGIPFAAPPMGKLRWKPPQAPASWSGVRRADSFGAPCMQPASPKRLGPWTRAFLSELPSSEDCLYLNIWTTPRSSSGLRPVMVWIYGGGFTSGAGSVAIYDGSALARKGVVVVNFNYRLGAFGFLAYPGLTKESPHHSSGNYALLDQIAALHWVKENIAGFGGDPHQVTIFGQSAGAASVWLLMQSPLARGLFERAIVMSGPAVIPAPAITGHISVASAEEEGQKFAAKLDADSVAALRAVSPEKITQAARAMRWGPIRDGWVLRSGRHPQHETTVISGMVADDIGIGYYGNGPAPTFTMKEYEQKLSSLCGDRLADCRKLYPAANPDRGARAIRTALQDRARVSLYKWAVRQSVISPAVYIYYFDREIPWPEHPEYGVFHSSERPYIFDNLRLMSRPWQPVDRRVADEMSSYWANFAKSGTPDTGNLPSWPTFRSRKKDIMQIGAQMEPIPLASSSRLQFWLKNLKEPLGLGSLARDSQRKHFQFLTRRRP